MNHDGTNQINLTPNSQSQLGSIRLSPDGTKIVYVANGQLYLRNLNELTSRPIQGTNENPTTPIFSPDGLWVGYNSGLDRQWKRISVSGGAPVTLSEPTPFPSGATWGSDNTILFGLLAYSIPVGTTRKQSLHT